MTESIKIDGVDNYGHPRQEYADELAQMDDAAFVKAASDAIYMSAWANNNPHADWHWHASTCYGEATRRGNVDLYQRAYDQARRMAGHI